MGDLLGDLLDELLDELLDNFFWTISRASRIDRLTSV
jgi:hypothetical protein